MSRRHETRRTSPSAAARARDTLPPTLAACGAVVAIDQGTKALALSRLTPGERVEVLPVLAFERTTNSGIAFGLAGGVPSLVIGATLVVLIGVLAFLALRDDAAKAIWLPGALLIGGALGNLADRVREGAVTDFIDLPLWPTFNLADVAIVTGVVLLLLSAERGGRESEA